jgi:hypothetical protein
MTDMFHSPAFDDALQNIGHALLATDPRRELARVLATFRDEYRAEVLDGRCPSCEHEIARHDVDGLCWFVVSQGIPEGSTACLCALRQDPAPPAQPVSASEGDPADKQPVSISPAALLNETERRMLAYALDETQEKIWSEGGFTDEDQGAVDSLRRLLVEAAPVHSVVADAEQRLVRAREVHQETCLLARGDVKPTAFTCGMCEALAPAGH